MESDMPQQLFTPHELAAYLEISTRTLIRWRQQRIGPAWVRAGHHVRYRAQDVDEWLRRQRHEPVLEGAAA